MRAPQLAHVRDLAQDADVDGLIAYLNTNVDRGADWSFRRAAAATALGGLHADAAVEPLARILRRPDSPPLLRLCAADALRNIGGPQAATDLVSVLEDPDYNVRERAIRAIGESGATELSQHLVSVLESEAHWMLKGWAADGLGELGLVESVPALVEVVYRERFLVAGEAIHSLRMMDNQVARDQLKRLRKDAPTRPRRWLARWQLRRASPLGLDPTVGENRGGASSFRP